MSEIENKTIESQEDKDNNRLQHEKARQNLVYVSMFSIIMLFAGLTSAYIVSMGDSFWLKFPLPTAFYISTAIIVLSSLTFVVAVKSAKKGELGKMKVAISITFLLGLSFVYFQFKGYGQLVDNGIHPANNHIFVTNGKYGDYFYVKYKGDFIEVNGNDFLLKGTKMTDEQMKEYQNFMSQFYTVEEGKPFIVEQYGKDFEIYFHNVPLVYKDKHLLTEEGEDLPFLDRIRLAELAINVRDERGDFFPRGEIGKDFHIYYKGKELEYVDRELKLNGKKLSNYLQIKSMESADTASSYLYLITVLHLLHIVFTLFYLLKLVIGSFSGSINEKNTITMRMGASFWHFLGILWLYLLLFLLFIH